MLLWRILLIAWLACLAGPSARAQTQSGPPPSVGVLKVERKPVTIANEFVGRVQAVEQVKLLARVTAFLDKRFFVEGAEVKQGDLLYRLEQGPFQAQLQASQAAIAQIEAQLQNAEIVLARARSLLTTPAGQQSTVDAALANQRALEAQLSGAEAQLDQAKINLGYTEIRAPIDGKIGRTAVTPGNVVGPTTGVLTTIVSQDPMYVTFPVSARIAIELRDRYAAQGGLTAATVKLRLPNGQIYRQTGKPDFLDNAVAGATDTILLRGVVPNPPAGDGEAGPTASRELVDQELVTVILEDPQPTAALVVPRTAVLSDQNGDSVFVVDDKNVARQRRVTLGQTTPTGAVVQNGIEEGEMVVVEGIQRVRNGALVAPGPPNAPANAPQTAGAGAQPSAPRP